LKDFFSLILDYVDLVLRLLKARKNSLIGGVLSRS